MSASKPSISVVAAGIIAIAGAALAIFGAAMAMVALYITPQANPETALPAYVLSLALVMNLVFLGLAIFGIVTGIGVIRLKNWARISILIWAGITVFFSAIALVAVLMVPFPVVEGGPPIDLRVVKGIMAAFYGVPILIGVWWLILFNRKSTKAQFVAAPDAELPGTAAGPKCPFPVAIIAGFLLFSFVWMPFILFIHMPFPVILFGHRIYGTGGKAFFLLTSVALLIGAMGLLKLRRWSYPLVLGVQFFWLASGTITILSPSYEGIMQEVLSEVYLPKETMVAFGTGQFRLFSVMGLIFSILNLGILIYYRRRFLEMAAAKEMLPPR